MLKQYLRVLRTADNTGSLKLSIDNATGAVKDVLEDLEGSGNTFRPAPFEVYTPTYQEARKAEYTTGKIGIGPMALNNAHLVMTQLTKLKLASNPFTNGMGITDLGRIFDQPTDTDRRGSRILDWMSAMINAFVDIAKDPYIVRLNVNAWTYNMTSFLLRSGMGKRTFYFLYQPILREMALEVLKTKGKYGVDRTKTPSLLEQEAINRVLDKYDPDGKYRRTFELINRDDTLSASTYALLWKTRMKDGEETFDLREMLKDPEFVGNSNRAQVMVYYMWLKFKPYADALANLVKYSKVDTKKYGNTFAALLNYYRGMLSMLDNPCFAQGEIRRFYDETFIGHKSDNAILLGNRIFSNQLLRCTDLLNELKDTILALLGRRDRADDKLVNSVITALETQIKASFFNRFMRENGIDAKTMFRGLMSMAKRLNNFKALINRRDPRMAHLIDNNGNITNDFLEFLLPNINDIDGTENIFDFVDTSELLDIEQSKANNLINYWRELIEDPNPLISKLFKDLVVYAFITSGDNPVMNAFFQFVPNSYRIQMGYALYMREQLSDYVNGHSSLINIEEDLFKNNWSNDKLVKPIQIMDNRNNPMLSIYRGSTIPSIIMGARLNRSGNLSAAINPINWITDDKDGSKYPIFPPYVKTRVTRGNRPEDWHLYLLVGYNTETDRGRINYFPVYGLVSKKGYKYRGHTVTEYGVETQFDFNKENELDYTEAMNNSEELGRIANAEAGSTAFSEYWQHVRPISSLLSYMDDNYRYSHIDTTNDIDIDEDTNLPDFEGTPLEEKPEPDAIQRPAVSIDARITALYDVVIDPALKSNYARWQQLNPNGIVAYRVNFSNYNTPEEANAGRIGNPFSEDSRGADTVEKFLQWLLTGNNYGEPKATEAYRQAIISKTMLSPVGTPILYYKELGRPSHATVIGYLINHKYLLRDVNPRILNNVQFNRSEALNNPRTLYIFTDNTDRDSGSNPVDPNSRYSLKYGSDKHYPTTTQAVLRGLDNAMPISTQHYYHDGAKGASGRWNDSDFNEFKSVIDAEIEDIKREFDTGKYDNVAFGGSWFNTNISNISQLRTPRLYLYLQSKYNELVDYINNSVNISDYNLHSGGAIGADTVWGLIAVEYGIPNTPGRLNHYYNNQRTPGGNVQISTEDYNEGRYKVAQAAKANWGYKYDTMKDDRLIRNWSQVKHSDAVFAVGTMVKAGERIFPNIPNDTRTAQHTAVTGGTGYAVEMAIQAGKPVYVFDQSRNRWFKNIGGEWSVSDIPVLTHNFAGIGTRQIQLNGIDAIRAVFEKTFGAHLNIEVDRARQQALDQVNQYVQEGSITREQASRFQLMLNDENPSTIEEVEGLLNKFICNL